MSNSVSVKLLMHIDLDDLFTRINVVIDRERLKTDANYVKEIQTLINQEVERRKTINYFNATYIEGSDIVELLDVLPQFNTHKLR